MTHHATTRRTIPAVERNGVFVTDRRPQTRRPINRPSRPAPIPPPPLYFPPEAPVAITPATYRQPGVQPGTLLVAASLFVAALAVFGAVLVAWLALVDWLVVQYGWVFR